MAPTLRFSAKTRVEGGNAIKCGMPDARRAVLWRLIGAESESLQGVARKSTVSIFAKPGGISASSIPFSPS